jgi:23S rRNA pseudouridine2605 synthase
MKKTTSEHKEETVRLNKFLAQAGIASRRKADDLIANGYVKVNGIVVTELGRKVKTSDAVICDGKRLHWQERKVYILLNKPKDVITTAEDEQGRTTVIDLVRNLTQERVFPVGRLDRLTTGLLLLTNDGTIANRLTHPSYGVEKIYKVRLNKSIAQDDFRRALEGVALEDGKACFDEAEILDPKAISLGVKIHEGRNRLIRRLFEALGYEVTQLDRVKLGPLTKAKLPRGKARLLTSREIRALTGGLQRK